MSNDFGKPFFYGCFDGSYLIFRIHLLPVNVPHVKYIHNLIHFCGNFSNPDVQAGFEDGICQGKEEARKIIGKHFDDGEETGTVIIHDNVVRQLGGLGPDAAMAFHFLSQGLGKVQAS